MLKSNRTVLVILSFLSLALVVGLSSGFYYRFWFQGLDSSGFLELINRSFNEKSLSSNSFASAVDFVRLVWNPAYDCAKIIDYKINSNIISIHAYSISYVLSFVQQFSPFSSLALVSVLLGVNFALPIVFGLLIFLKIPRTRNSLKTLSLRFVLLLMIFTIIIWPPFLLGIQGQFYFDRLSISLLFIVGFLLPNVEKLNKNKSLIFAFTLFIIPLISERTTLISLLVSLVALYKIYISREEKSTLKKILTFHLIFYFFYYFNWKLNFADPNLNTFPNFDALMNRAQLLVMNFNASGLLVFIIILMPILLANLYSRINFILTLLLAMPNLIFNLGGAELNGYLTHYHSLYIGFAIAGLYRSYFNIFLSNSKLIYRLMFTSLLLCSCISSLFYYNSFGSIFRNIKSSLGFESIYQFKENKSLINDTNKQLSKVINMESSFSISENLFPFFVYRGISNMKLFPLGIGDSEYVITQVDVESGLPFMYPWVFPELDDRKKVQICLQKRLESQYLLIEEWDYYRFYQKANQ